MARGANAGLNETGEMLMTRIVRGAAVHVGCGEQTLRHSHYAWKLHVGLDAPIWVDSVALNVDARAGLRVVVIPPGLEHRVGATGLSLTLLVNPGTHATAWRGEVPIVHAEAQARRIVDAASGWQFGAPDATGALASEVLRLAVAPNPGATRVDVRVRRALARLSRQPDIAPSALASQLGISLDRLSHLVASHTGTKLRRHALWSRLMRLLSSNKRFSSIAAAAADAGFADHAHMTRSYRAMLGRLPSEFSAPPEAVEAWASD